MKTLALSLSLVGLAGCSDDARIEVYVIGAESVASVEVVDRAVWYGEVGNDEGYSDILEDADLPAVFEVPPGSYAVAATQGTCSDSREREVEASEQVIVSLSLECAEVPVW